MSISFIIPSLNRPTLHRTIASIDVWDGDEILVEFDIPKSNRWGNDQRNSAMARAKGDFLAFIDDDDWYSEDHRWLMDEAMQANPKAMTLFKMQYPNGETLWKTNELIPGNVSTPMILVPNNKELLYNWEGGRNMADFIFINRWLGDVVWNPAIIAHLHHNDGEANND